MDGYRYREFLENGRLVGNVYDTGLVRLERRDLFHEFDQQR